MAHWPRALILAVFLSLTGLAQAPASKSALDKATMEAYLRHLNAWGPQVTLQIDDPVPSPLLDGFFDVHIKATMGPRSGEITYLVSADGRKIVQANVFDINWNPFRDELAKLKTDGAPSFGTPGATVVIVMFSDFECGYCKQQAEVLRQNVLKDYPKQVRVYFKDYPLQAIHPWAKDAAIAGRCIYRQKSENFWDVHDFYFEKQSEITPENLKAKTLEFAKSKGWDNAALASCIDNKATAAEVEKSAAEGVGMGINSTPTMFVNGRRITSMTDWPTLKTMIDNELEYQKTAKNAGEDCGCDLSLPVAPGTPVKPTPTLTPTPKK